MRYRWAQFTRYLRLARKRAAQKRLDHLVGTNQAFSGGDAAMKLQKSLIKQIEDADRDR